MDKIGQADWLLSSKSQKVIAALESVRPGCARFVGGCVRNTIMDRPVDDIDIATQLTPEIVMTALKAADIRAIPTGIEHGTITAILDSEPFEITTLRRDVETDGRRAVVAFTEDWREDAMRRDFRLNALYAEPNGTLHDPVGGGIEDAKNGRVIFIGDGDERLREDYLRILRFFRFNAWYGADIDADGLAACARQSAGLEKIAAERIWKELKKLLAAPDPREAVLKMAESGVLAQILPSANIEGVEKFDNVTTTPDPMQRLMALLSPRDETIEHVVSSLKMSNDERGRLDSWVAAHNGMNSALMEGLARHRAYYRFGVQAVLDVLALQQGGHSDRLKNALNEIENWQRPNFPIGGDDALAAGLKGIEIGRALKTLERNWIESNFELDREALLEQLKNLS